MTVVSGTGHEASRGWLRDWPLVAVLLLLSVGLAPVAINWQGDRFSILLVVAGAGLLALLATSARVRRALGLGGFAIALVAASALGSTYVIAGAPFDDFAAAAVVVVAGIVCVRPLPAGDRWQGLFFVSVTGLCLASVCSALSAHVASLAFVPRLLSYVAVVVLLRRAPEQNRASVRAATYIIAVIAAATVYMSYAGVIKTSVTFADPLSGDVRAGGLLGHPNFAAYFLSVVVIALVWDKGVRPLLRWPLIIFLLMAILLTGSQAAVLTLGVCLLLSLRRWWKQSPALGMALLVFGGVAANTLLARLHSVEQMGGIAGNNTLTWRFMQWHQALALKGPGSLFGVGWSNAKNLLPDQLEVHSGYLQVLVELGLIGAVFLLALLLALGWLAWLGRSDGSLVIFLFLTVTNLTDLVILYPSVTYVSLVLMMSATGSERPALDPLSGSCLSRGPLTDRASIS